MHPFSAALQRHTPAERPLADLRPAAVLVLLTGPADDERILLQVRTHRVAQHPGEISLPGGRRDPGDPSFLHTALRETHEEVGVPPEAVHVLGALDDEEAAVSRHLVRPYVGVLAEGVSPRITAPGEVAQLLYVPVAHLMDDRSRVWKAVEQDGLPSAMEAWDYEGHVIWGVTHRILTGFLGVIGAAAR